MKITIQTKAALPGAPETSALVGGDVITVDGVPFDLSGVPEGGFATPEGDHPFIGRITRIDGELHVRLRWRYAAAAAEPVQPAELPALSVSNGPVPDPIVRNPQTSEAKA
ncbi:hypothetical protein ETW23_07600 [Leisingera sp. NJS201]|uniref:hypothetical protein n=1 Tax=Leisingera sp. NJS201 TaxID=2508306 RepID=UPI001070BC83|nr:hypothetical protein [Leisingera sp. NJS201]QBR36025.1 hypothetical protein ETW23_07600 [Leisingera sp. NJS201]